MEQQTFNIKFDGIELVEKNLFRAVIKENSEFVFETKIQTLIDPNKKLIVAFVSVHIKSIDGNDLFNIVCAFGFQIIDFDKALGKDEKGQYSIPAELEYMIRSISISTMRGVIFAELRGTTLHKAVLPIIMVDSLVPVEGDVVNVPARN